MIFGWIRLFVFGFVGLTVIYWLVSVYSRSVRRETLEKRFDAGDVEGDRDAYIEQGMTKYEKGLRKRLIWLVYIIPMVAMALTIYFVN
ncbi:MAG: hypothetical protein K9G71_04035 [Rhodobacteraceae bacterium]|jgi:hypothetical protein|nr:hypothetical protein [Paracoccaceae bacterium]MCF8513352.1 hypothetical protein [Paracoccaceae bacterium]MCF8517748.1 hypothetical protein [Paracoccaceae bacterium]